jgi:DNA-binding beta-propeller fold protein YncE
MKSIRAFLVPSLAAGLLLLSAGPIAAFGQYQRVAVITVPGKPLSSFDISWVDGPSETYFVADRNNAALDIINAEDNTFVSRIGGFVGFTGSNAHSGPDGVEVDHSAHQAWVGDGNSTVKVVDLATDFHSGAIVDTISTGGTARADELAIATSRHILMVANPDDDVPFLTFISTKTHAVLGKLFFPQATDGLEQPVWDEETHQFLQAVPGTPTNPGGEVDAVDPESMMVTAVFPLSDCHPHGMTLGPDQHLLVGCSVATHTVVIDARDGSLVADIRGFGGSDQVWFNPGDNHYYLAARGAAGGPKLGVVDAESNTLIDSPSSGVGAHSVAADRKDNHIFVPIGAPDPTCPIGCIAVYANTGAGSPLEREPSRRP